MCDEVKTYIVRELQKFHGVTPSSLALSQLPDRADEQKGVLAAKIVSGEQTAQPLEHLTQEEEKGEQSAYDAAAAHSTADVATAHEAEQHQNLADVGQKLQSSSLTPIETADHQKLAAKTTAGSSADGSGATVRRGGRRKNSNFGQW